MRRQQLFCVLTLCLALLAVKLSKTHNDKNDMRRSTTFWHATPDKKVWYNARSMRRHVTPIDISHIPDLVRIVEEMKNAKEPRILKQGSAPVAMLVPMATATQQHKSIAAFDLKPLAEIRGTLLDAGY